MKTIYPLQNRPRKEVGRWTPYSVSAIVVLLVFLLFLIVPTFVPASTHVIGKPLWAVRNFFGAHFGDVKAFALSRTTMLERNKELQQELDEARTQLLALSVYKRENDEFKNIWGRENVFQGVLGVVLSKPPQSTYDTFILDIGSNQGIEIGDRVIVSDTIFLGTIDEVFDTSSRAKLFSSVDTDTLAVIDRTSISVTLNGKGNGNFEIKAPQELDIEVNDTIVLPGINPSIIAKVVEIEDNPQNSFKRVYAQTPVNISNLNSVLVAH
jgi:cell shape-determining protein MreC